MTVSSTTNKVTYTASGGTTFAYTFRIFNKTDLEVYDNGVQRTVDIDYTVTNVGVASGGNVIFGTAPISGHTILIQRVLPLTQEHDYQEGDPFPAETHEANLDRLIMIAQQLNRKMDDIVVGAVDHGTISGLGDDDHPQYPLLAGRSGGQILKGGTGSGNNLRLQSTSHATKGKVELGDGTDYYDETNKKLYITEMVMAKPVKIVDTYTAAGIQAAVNSLTYGGTIWLVRDAYNIESEITIPTGREITIKGMGMGYQSGHGTQLISALSSGRIFNLSANIVGFKLENLRIVGNADTDGAIKYAGNYAFAWNLQNIWIVDFTKAGAIAIDLEDVSHVNMANVWAGNVEVGLQIKSDTLESGLITLVNCGFGINTPCNYPIKLVGGAGIIQGINLISVLSKGSENVLDMSGSCRNINLIDFHGELHKANGSGIVIRSGRGINILGSSVYGLYTGVESQYGIHLTSEGYTCGVDIRNFAAHLKAAGAAVRLETTGGNIVRGSVELGYIDLFTVTTVLSDPGSTAYTRYSYDSIDIASAATIAVLGNGDFFNVTGSTQIDTILASGFKGRRVTLKFNDNIIISDGVGNLSLAGVFNATAADTLTLVCDGTSWYEVARSAN